MKHWGLFLPHCLGLEIRPNVFYNEVLQSFLVLVDGACEAKFAKETSRDKLLYIKPFFLPPIPFFTSLGWKCKEHTFVASVSLKCGPTSRRIFTSHSCRTFWSFGKPKNPTRFPSGSTVPFCVQNRAHNNRYLTSFRYLIVHLFRNWSRKTI